MNLMTEQKTAAQRLTEYVRDEVYRADIEVGAFRAEPEGTLAAGWIRAVVVCGDGTRVPWGVNIHTPMMHDADPQTEAWVATHGYAMRVYDVGEMLRDPMPSERLCELCDAARDEHGAICHEIPGAPEVLDSVEQVAKYAVLAWANRGELERQCIDAYRDSLLHHIRRQVGYLTTGELVGFLEAL